MARNTVVAIGAHPDDIVLGLGGLACILRQRGWTVIFCCATLGEIGGNHAQRRQEESASAEHLGAQLEFGNLPDGGIDFKDAMQLTTSLLQRYQPGMVFVHDSSDTHQDHVQLGEAAMRVCPRSSSLYFYEGPTTIGFAPNVVADITNVWESKRQSLLCHESQTARLDLVEWMDSVTGFRSWPRYRNSRCEAFRVYCADMFDFIEEN